MPGTTVTATFFTQDRLPTEAGNHATAVLDYPPTTKDFVFTNGTYIGQYIDVQIVNDTSAEPTEDFKGVLMLTSENPGATDEAIASIVDDDGSATPSWSVSAATVTEPALPGGLVPLKATISTPTPAAADMLFTWWSSLGPEPATSATHGSDYDGGAAPAQAVIPAGQTSVPVELLVKYDFVPESSETVPFQVFLNSNPSQIKPAIGTILNNGIDGTNNRPPVGVSDGPYMLTAADTAFSMNVLANDTDPDNSPGPLAGIVESLPAASEGTLKRQNGTLLHVGDSFSGYIVFHPQTSWTGSSQFRYHPYDGAADGSPAFVTLLRLPPGKPQAGIMSIGTQAYEVAAGDSTAPTEAKSVSFVLFLDRMSPTDTTVQLFVSGTAESNKDFVPFLTSVTIPAGTQSKSFQVVVLDDALVEGTENFTITIVPDSAYVPASQFSAATVAIHDNDFWAWRASDANQGGTTMNAGPKYIPGYSNNPFGSANLTAQGALNPYEDLAWNEQNNSVAMGVQGQLTATFKVPNSLSGPTKYNALVPFDVHFTFDTITGAIDVNDDYATVDPNTGAVQLNGNGLPRAKKQDGDLEATIAWDLEIDNSGNATHTVRLFTDFMVGVGSNLSTTYAPIVHHADGSVTGSLAGSFANTTNTFTGGKTFVFHLDVYSVTYEDLP